MGAKQKEPAKRRNRGKKAQREVVLKPGHEQRKADDIFGFMAGRLEIIGDIESPTEDWAHWNPAKKLEK
jgi:hypothetical protein